jgi:hypothetical protein
MNEEPIRSETDILLEFIERILPLLEGGLLDVKKISTEEIVAETVMEHGDLAGRRPFTLSDIPEAVSSALRGDRENLDAIAVLVHTVIGGASVFNAMADLAIAGEKKLTDGVKELGDFFAGNLPESVRTKWYLSLYVSMFYSLELSLLPRVIDYFKEIAKIPVYHYFHILDSLLLDSFVRRATCSQSFYLKPLYEFFIDDKTGLSREINEIINDMKDHGFQFVFVTTRVEPRVLFLSWLLRYCLLKRKYVLKPIIPDDPTRGYVVIIELTDELIREVNSWKSWQFVKSRLSREFIKVKMSILAKYKAPITPHDPDYLDFKCAGPYVFFFSSLEGVGGDTSKKDLLGRPFQKEALTNIAVPFLSYIFPFIRVSIIDDRTFITISGRTKREALTLFQVLAYGSHLSTTYAAQLLSGVHALRRLKLGRSKSGLDELFERIRTADYGPFLPPDIMIRHSLLFVDSMLFKLTNALLKRAGKEYQAFVFEPTGNFEEDIRRLWEMSSLEAHQFLQNLYGIKDVDDLLKLVDRESYELFMKVWTTPLEVCSAYLTKAYLTERARRMERVRE